MQLKQGRWWMREDNWSRDWSLRKEIRHEMNCMRSLLVGGDWIKTRCVLNLLVRDTRWRGTSLWCCCREVRTASEEQLSSSKQLCSSSHYSTTTALPLLEAGSCRSTVVVVTAVFLRWSPVLTDERLLPLVSSWQEEGGRFISWNFVLLINSFRQNIIDEICFYKGFYDGRRSASQATWLSMFPSSSSEWSTSWEGIKSRLRSCLQTLSTEYNSSLVSREQQTFHVWFLVRKWLLLLCLHLSNNPLFWSLFSFLVWQNANHSQTCRLHNIILWTPWLKTCSSRLSFNSLDYYERTKKKCKWEHKKELMICAVILFPHSLIHSVKPSLIFVET